MGTNKMEETMAHGEDGEDGDDEEDDCEDTIYI